MKYLKWLLLLPVAVYPYIYFVVIMPGLPEDIENILRWLVNTLDLNIWSFIGLTWLVGLAGALLIFLSRKHWTARELALANMLIKLIHIPSYMFWFIFGIAMILFMGPVWAFLMDAMTIALSGLAGLAAVLRCRAEGRLTTGAAVVSGILQFVFCADVFSAIWVYIKSRKEKERLP